MVDALNADKIGAWRDHDPRMRTTHFLLDGRPYSGATHPMRVAGRGGLVHYSGVRHTAESRLLTFSLQPVIIPEDLDYMPREERIPRSELDGMFERQPIEQDVYDTTGKLVAVRTVLRARASPFNGERHKPRPTSNIVTTRLLPTQQQRVIDRVNGADSAADIPSTSAPPPEPPSTTMQLPGTPQSAQSGEQDPALQTYSPFTSLRNAGRAIMGAFSPQVPRSPLPTFTPDQMQQLMLMVLAEAASQQPRQQPRSASRALRFVEADQANVTVPVPGDTASSSTIMIDHPTRPDTMVIGTPAELERLAANPAPSITTRSRGKSRASA